MITVSKKLPCACAVVVSVPKANENKLKTVTILQARQMCLSLSGIIHITNSALSLAGIPVVG